MGVTGGLSTSAVDWHSARELTPLNPPLTRGEAEARGSAQMVMAGESPALQSHWWASHQWHPAPALLLLVRFLFRLLIGVGKGWAEGDQVPFEHAEGLSPSFVSVQIE